MLWIVSSSSSPVLASTSGVSGNFVVGAEAVSDFGSEDSRSNFCAKVSSVGGPVSPFVSVVDGDAVPSCAAAAAAGEDDEGVGDLALAKGLAPANAPKPSEGPFFTADADGNGLEGVEAAASVAGASSFALLLRDPRLLGLIPPNEREGESVFLALNAAKLFLLELAPPDEVGTALKGEDRELNEENVGCVRAGSAGADSGGGEAGVADEVASSTLATFVAGGSATFSSGFASSDVDAVSVLAMCFSPVLMASTFLRMTPTFSVSTVEESTGSDSSTSASERFFLVGTGSEILVGVVV